MDALIETLFAYDDWANRIAAESVKTAGAGQEAALKQLAHIVGAHRVWLARVEGKDSTPAPWPELTREDCRAAFDELHQRWSEIFRTLTPERLAEPIVYRTTKGVEYGTPLRDALLQVAVHGAYHRGQIAAAVRQAGGKPSPTDYIVYARQLAASAGAQ